MIIKTRRKNNRFEIVIHIEVLGRRVERNVRRQVEIERKEYRKGGGI